MKCDPVKEHLVNYLKGELDHPERLLIDGHLAECESCRSELYDMEILWEGLEKLSEKAPSLHLRDRFYSSLNNEISLQNSQALEQSRKPGWEDLFQSLWPSRPRWALSYSMVIIICGFALGRLFLADEIIDSAGVNQPQIVQFQEQVAELRDLMALTLLNADSVQARLRGIDYARANSSTDPGVLALLLNTVERDETRNVRLAALDALKSSMDNTMVKERIYNRLLFETSPIVQLKIVELLLKAAGDGEQALLDELLNTGILDPAVAGFLQAAGAGSNHGEQQEDKIEL